MKNHLYVTLNDIYKIQNKIELVTTHNSPQKALIFHTSTGAFLLLSICLIHHHSTRVQQMIKTQKQQKQKKMKKNKEKKLFQRWTEENLLNPPIHRQLLFFNRNYRVQRRASLW